MQALLATITLPRIVIAYGCHAGLLRDLLQAMSSLEANITDLGDYRANVDHGEGLLSNVPSDRQLGVFDEFAEQFLGDVKGYLGELGVSGLVDLSRSEDQGADASTCRVGDVFRGVQIAVANLGEDYGGIIAAKGGRFSGLYNEPLALDQPNDDPEYINAEHVGLRVQGAIYEHSLRLKQSGNLCNGLGGVTGIGELFVRGQAYTFELEGLGMQVPSAAVSLMMEDPDKKYRRSRSASGTGSNWHRNAATPVFEVNRIEDASQPT